jgi:hypothetical protein
MLWQLQFFPTCSHDVFLSHCSEDRDWLIFPLFESLQRKAVVPWLDRHDYPYGRTSFAALRDGVLKSRHTVFFVTAAMLRQSRGWGIVELAWADLLQENLREAGGMLQNVILPLFFLSQDDAQLPRSIWQSLRDRAKFHRPTDGDAAAWAAEQVTQFLLREAVQAQDYAIWLQQDSRARRRLNQRQGLIERITLPHFPLLLPPPVAGDL